MKFCKIVCIFLVSILSLFHSAQGSAGESVSCTVSGELLTCAVTGEGDLSDIHYMRLLIAREGSGVVNANLSANATTYSVVISSWMRTDYVATLYVHYNSGNHSPNPGIAETEFTLTNVPIQSGDESVSCTVSGDLLTCAVKGEGDPNDIHYMRLLIAREGSSGTVNANLSASATSYSTDISSWIRTYYVATLYVHYNSGNHSPNPGTAETEFTLTDGPPQDVVSYLFDGNMIEAFSGVEGITDSDVDYVNGKQGKALLLNGAERVNISDRFGNINTLSITAWVKFDDKCSDGRYCRIIAKHTSGPGLTGKSFSFQRQAESDGGKLQARFYDSDGYVSVTGTNSLKTGVWYHLATTFDQGVAKVYVNGLLEAESNQKYNVSDQLVAGEVNIQSSNSPVFIGASNSDTQYFAGLIDNLSIHLQLLSDDQILRLARQYATQAIPIILLPLLLDD